MVKLLKGIVTKQENLQPKTDNKEKEKEKEDVISNDIYYYFDIVTEHSISLQNQITDNWVENNTAIQDHIAQSPLTITLRGLSAYKNLTYTTEQAENDAEKLLLEIKQRNSIQDKTSKLTALSVLFPEVCNITQLAINAYNYANESINRYKGIANKFINSNSPMDKATGSKSRNEETRLMEIYRKLSTLRSLNTAFIVATPYGAYENMYIQSLLLRQGENNYVTDIELTMKQINFANTITTEADKEVLSRLSKIQKALEKNKGLSQGTRQSLAAGWWVSRNE